MMINIRIHSERRAPSRMVFLLVLCISFALYFFLNFLPKTAPVAIAADTLSQPEVAYTLPPLEEHREEVSRGKTLSDILEGYQFSPAEVHKLRNEVKPIYDLAKIRAGQEFRFFTFQDGSVLYFEYDIDRDRYLHIEHRAESYYAEIRHFPFETVTKLIWGQIEDFPLNTLQRQGESAPLGIALEEIFAWDVDFRTDIQPGDTFKIVFEKKYKNGEFAGYGRVLAAEFANKGRVFQAFRFTYPDTDKTDYYNYEGASLRKEFLKSPLKSPRITSRFSSSRLHPVWKTYRPHYGVDYGAPVGTRVYATGDGVVTAAGWSGASGRMIRIRHNKGYETMYLHLRRFAPGIKRGARVTGGQYIAQVGASGAVSGPHLDYRIKHHGKYINPLAARFDPVEPLRTEFLDDFQKKAAYYSLAFDAPLVLFAKFTYTYSPPRPVELGD
jgi:murein DD-endopeptidase MepM/ murein hydrolase activator NlpD